MLRLKMSQISTIAAVLLLLVSFQNCSETKFSATDAGLAANNVNGQPNDSDDQAVNEETGEMEPVAEYEADRDCLSFQSQVLPAGLRSLSSEVIRDSRGSAIFTAENVDIENHRGKAYISSAVQAHIANSRGKTFIRSVSARDLADLRGSLCLVFNSQKAGDTNVGSVDRIFYHRGRLELVGFNSDLIEDTRGPLYIRGGHVKAVRNHRGPIYIVGGRLDELHNHRGPVIVTNGGQGPTVITDARF